MEDRLAPHVKELAKALGNVDESDIRKQLQQLLEYRVPMDEAKRTVLRKFKSGTLSLKQVKDLSAGLKGFEITGRVIDIKEKTVNLRGEKAVIFSGILADGTGACPFTSWADFSLRRGDVIRIRNAYTRTWHGRPEVNFGDRSSVTKLPEDTLPSIDELSIAPVKKLTDISSTDLSVSSVAMVAEMYHRDVNIRGRDMTIIEGVICDETAKLPFTSRVPLQGVDIGKVIRFEGASVRVFRGVPSITIDEKTSFEIVGHDEDLLFSFESISKEPAPMSISKILQKEGLFDIVGVGNIISIRPGSGIITRCPVCNRVIIKNTCRAHGKVDGVADMRIKLILDDGTGALSVMLNRELSEIVYGRSMFEAEDIIHTAMSQDAVFEDMRRVLTGRYLSVRGNTSRTEFGVILVARSVSVPGDDMEHRVKDILRRLGEENING